MGWPGSLNNLMILKILNRSVKHFFFVMRLCPSVFIKHTLLTFKLCNDGVGFLPFMFSSLNCVKYSRNKLIYFLFLWDNPPPHPTPRGGDPFQVFFLYHFLFVLLKYFLRVYNYCFSFAILNQILSCVKCCFCFDI